MRVSCAFYLMVNVEKKKQCSEVPWKTLSSGKIKPTTDSNSPPQVRAVILDSMSYSNRSD